MTSVTPEQVTGIVTALTAMIAAIGGIVAAIYGKQSKAHAAEASHEATHARRAADYGVSQNASLQQAITEHCGTMCPAIICPMRRKEEQHT